MQIVNTTSKQKELLSHAGKLKRMAARPRCPSLNAESDVVSVFLVPRLQSTGNYICLVRTVVRSTEIMSTGRVRLYTDTNLFIQICSYMKRDGSFDPG